MTSSHGFAGPRLRRERLRALMERLDVDAVILRRHSNFAWYTGGADNRVDHASELGVAEIVVTGSSEYVLTNNIESERMRREQPSHIEVVDFPWYGDSGGAVRELTGGGTVASDLPRADQLDVDEHLAPLRYTLDDDALSRYRAVGADTASALREAADAVLPGMNELEAAALVLASCRRRGMFAPVVMAAGDDRIVRYRHPVSVDHTFHRRVMLVVCAERGGLYGNLTVFRDFEKPDAETERRMTASGTILRRMREEATKPGRTLAEAFSDCQRFYEDAGYPDEWRLHHQGGLTGFAAREVVATPATSRPIEVNQAFAWNPSITGGKAEDTFVLTAAGPEVLTHFSEA